MAKRDRDTAIWRDPFYRALPPLYKTFWDFINDDCDNSGVWLVDFKVASLQIGKRLDQEKAVELFAPRILVFESGMKWHIKTFIPVVLGFSDLDVKSKFQKSIIDLLGKHKLTFNKGSVDTLQSVKERTGTGERIREGQVLEIKKESKNDFYPSDILRGDEEYMIHLEREAIAHKVNLKKALDNWDAWYSNKFPGWRAKYEKDDITTNDLRKSFESWLRDPKSKDSNAGGKIDLTNL